MTVKQTQPTAKQQADMYVMIGKQMASSYPWWAMLIAFLMGAAVGLIVLGWWLWPVQWTQAKPASLSNDPQNNKGYMQAYLNFAATTYGTGSMSLEQTAYFLGEGWTVQDVTAVLDKMIAADYAQNRVFLEKFRNDLDAYGKAGGVVGPPNAPQNVAGISSQVAVVLAILILLLVIIGAFLILRRLRSEKPSPAAVTGAPEKVTALEVWVFDKNDVRTVTKVLMSEYAFNDPGLRAKLASKGDAVLAQPGEVVELKTQTLKINARIVDVVYGSGTPANSYFQQVTLELATWMLYETSWGDSAS